MFICKLKMNQINKTRKALRERGPQPSSSFPPAAVFVSPLQNHYLLWIGFIYRGTLPKHGGFHFENVGVVLFCPCTPLPVPPTLRCARLLRFVFRHPAKIEVLHVSAEGSGMPELCRSRNASEPQPVYTHARMWRCITPPSWSV